MKQPGTNTPSQWPADVCLVPEKLPSNKKRKLTEQPFILQAVIKFAIAEGTNDIILRKNWPEDSNRNVYGKELILKGCRDKQILHTYAIVREMKARLKTDPGFMKGLCDLVSAMPSPPIQLHAILRLSIASHLFEVQRRLKRRSVYLPIN